MKINNDNEQRLEQLSEKQMLFDKQMKSKKAVYMIMMFLITVFLVLIAALYSKSYVVIKLVIPIAGIVFLICFLTKDAIVFRTSKSLRTLDREIKGILKILNPQVAEAAEYSKMNSTSLFDILKTICGVLLFISGAVILWIAERIDFELYAGVTLFLLLFGLWLILYSMFVIITKRMFRSLYYPTFTLILFLAPPLIAAGYLDYQQERTIILSISLAIIFSIVLYSIFLYFSLFRPNKEKKKYIQDNIGLYREKERREMGMIELINKKNDRGKIYIINSNKHQCVMEENINGSYVKYKEMKFVEYNNAYYAVVKELMQLYEINDGRRVIRF